MLVLFYLVLYLFYYIIILYNVSSIQCYSYRTNRKEKEEIEKKTITLHINKRYIKWYKQKRYCNYDKWSKCKSWDGQYKDDDRHIKYGMKQMNENSKLFTNWYTFNNLIIKEILFFFNLFFYKNIYKTS